MVDTSPLPIRHLNSAPRPTVTQRIISIDDDELAEATIPCSPATHLRDRERERTTQPTQILSDPKATLNADFPSSSPPTSVVEIPASSPFQQPPRKPAQGLGSRLAPAGTFFRPPPRPLSIPTMAPKRRAEEDDDDVISIPSDDDDLTPPRGNIKSTTFKTQLAQYAYDAAEERKTKERLRQIYEVFGEKYSSVVAKEALRVSNNDLDDAIDWLEENGNKENAKAGQGKLPGTKPQNRRRLVSKASMQVDDRVQAPTSPTLPVLPKQAKKRLVQGLRRRDPSSTSPKKPTFRPPPPPSSEDPLVIDLVENDADAYEAEKSPSPDEDEDDKLLSSLNEGTLKELSAMTGEKEEELRTFIDKRPFKNLDQARKVSLPKKAGARKSARVSLGEKVVDAVAVFLNAVTTIDRVVAECEKKANLVKDDIRRWDIDRFGFDRRQKSATAGLPPSPTSESGLSRPPIPCQPSLMEGHCVMKPFQLFGLNWMSLLRKHKIGCILADEMGLGKTCQVISLISHLAESYDDRGNDRGASPPWPNLIVVPPSTYDNWLAEFEKFAPDLSIAAYRGSQAERAEIAYEVQQNLDEYHVVLAPYSQISTEEDIEHMQAMQLHAAIFDEGHKMKNPATKLYGFLRRIPSAWKMLLTGTPVQNNLLEMVSLLSFINPKTFEGYMEDIRYMFSQKVTIRDVSNGAFLYSERVQRAHKILEPFILQRRKDQVVSDMPRKVCSVVRCEMSQYQRELYMEYEKVFKTVGPKRGAAPARGRHNDQNNIWMQLRKAAIHPLLFRRHFTDTTTEKMAKLAWDSLPQDELRSGALRHLEGELKGSSDFELHLWCRDYSRLLGKFDYPQEREMDSGKVIKLLELLQSYEEKGDRVLVFSKFSRIIEMLQEVLATKDIAYRVLTGSTQVSERQQLINEFNEDESIPVFLLTTAAGGTGINLTSANKVIIFDQSDNPQDDIQAENRAHRLGQKREVEVIRLISTDTIEELVYKACQKKIELANKVTGTLTDEDGQEAEKNMEQEVRKMMEEQQQKDTSTMTPP